MAEMHEEWSWSDSDGESGERQLDSGEAESRGAPLAALADGSCGPLALTGSLGGQESGASKKAVKAGVRQMVALGLCSPQAAEMFLQLESDSRSESAAGRPGGEAAEQIAVTEARLAYSERALRESEERQLQLQAEIMRLTLNPQRDVGTSPGGVTAFDVARAQREAEKVMTLQRKVAEGEERERQQAGMQAKMEELLRLQEVALSEREENTAALEREVAEREAKVRLMTEQLSQTEQTHALEQQAAESEMAELKARNLVLEEGIVERDEQLRKTDGEKLRLHEIQMEEKEAQLRNLEARLAANGGDQIMTLKSTFSHTLEDRELRLATLEHEVRQVKSERDEAQKTYTAMQSTCRELRMESEHLQMALTIVEPKVHVLQAMISDIQLHLQGQLNGRDNKISTQQHHLDKTLPRMHGQMEEMKKAMQQRDVQISAMKQELESLRNLLKERESKIPELQDALEMQRQMAMKQQEDLLLKNQRIETLQSALDQMQFALDRTQKMMSEKESRLQLLQSSLDNSQPAMMIARKAIEERDMKLSAFHVLLSMGESQVQENVKLLDKANESLKEKDEDLKVLKAQLEEKDERITGMERSMTEWNSEIAEKDWQINAHESKISDLQDKLHSIDREQANETTNQPAANTSRVLGESVTGGIGPDDLDRIQVGALRFAALRSLNFGEPRDVRGSVVRAVPVLADQDLQNATLIKGRIVLIERGLCTFQEKAVRAYTAGAIGIIFINTEDEVYQPESAATQLQNSTPIPMLCVKKSVGAQLADGVEVAMCFSEKSPSVAISPSNRSLASHQAADHFVPQQLTARQRVLVGGQLQEWTRGKHSGSYVAGDSFIQATASAEILWRGRRCRIKRVRDGFSSALSVAKPAENNSKCGFSVCVESDERVSDVYDLELMAPSEQEKMQWITGILEVVKDQMHTVAPKYSGEQSNGMPKGKGLGEYANGDQYMGEWESGFQPGTANGIVPLPHGKGVYAWRNGDLYRGDWEKGVRSGFGTLETSDGAIYQGEWKDDRRNGSGIHVSANKEKYVGTFLESFPHGPGILTQTDGVKKSMEYAAGLETHKGPYPHPNAAMQASLAEMSKDARNAAKSAAQTAGAAQELCEQAEGLIHQVSFSSGAQPPPLTFSSLQRPVQIASSGPSTPGSIRPVNLEALAGASQAPQPAASSSKFRVAQPPPAAFVGSPITGTPQTPHAALDTGATFVQSPSLGMVGR